MEETTYGIYASKREVAKGWYNLRTNMKEDHEPLLNPSTMNPVTSQELAFWFGQEQASHEMEREVTFMTAPKEIFPFYQRWRPAPLLRAKGLEKALNTPAEIYVKYEGTGPCASYKVNAAAVEVYLAETQGYSGIVTFSGSGEWALALRDLCTAKGLNLTVFIPRLTLARKPNLLLQLESAGIKVIPSPSETTETGKKFCSEETMDGDVSIASAEAWERARETEGSCYVQDGILDHSLLYYAAIGKDTKPVFLSWDNTYPDVITANISGSSGWSGLLASFLRDRVRDRIQTRFVAAESVSYPNLTRGKYEYTSFNCAPDAPLVKTYSLGENFHNPGIFAADMCSHVVSPLLSKLYRDGYFEAVAYQQKQALSAGMLFAQTEGILPTAEDSYAVCAAIEEAKRCAQTGSAGKILLGISGMGYMDLAAYQALKEDRLEDNVPTLE